MTGYYFLQLKMVKIECNHSLPVIMQKVLFLSMERERMRAIK